MIVKNLAYILYEKMNFAHSEKEPTSLNRQIKTDKPYFYMWLNKDGSTIDIVTLEDKFDENSLKLFRLSREELYLGIDLVKSPPSLKGKEALKFLEENYLKKR